MATLHVSTADFQAGHFPEVCALTGYLAEQRYRMVAAGSPLVAGALPLSEEAAKGLQQRKMTALAAVSLGLLTGAVGLVLDAIVVALVGLALLMAGVALVRRLSKTITARQTGDGRVRLDGVHDDFVIAITRPAKCADCPGKSTCSVTEMATCDEHGEIIEQAQT